VRRIDIQRRRPADGGAGKLVVKSTSYNSRYQALFFIIASPAISSSTHSIS
jgi:hypothetical protein